ncbi:hypothetical protein GCM10022207_88950 [Streptomyces lannensis]|uniref:Uncharacterized protein n=1 Tax=Streptomyces lannensis TaxID=766498 RepID=A0ABP7LRW5_9ACTN
MVRHDQLPPEPHEEAAFLRVTVVCEAIMNDPLDAPPLLAITKAGVEVSQCHVRTLATAFVHDPGAGLKTA